MFAYVAAVVGMAAILLMSYRALGNPAITADDGVKLLFQVKQEIGQILATSTDGDGRDMLLPGLRRRLAGMQQMLHRAETAPDISMQEIDILGSVIDDLEWAAKLRSSSGFSENPAFAEACAIFWHHAHELLLTAGDPRK